MKAIVLKYGGLENSITVSPTPTQPSDPNEIGSNPTTETLGPQAASRYSDNSNRRRFLGTRALDVIL